MPGARSLAHGAYYAHPQNVFWPIMGRLLGFGRDLPYGERVERLRAGGLALWDVLASCHRRGSLDSAIDLETAVPNDIGALLQRHPTIGRIAFNGGGAERLFKRYVAPRLERLPKALRLPSTSPANARLRFDQKLDAWRALEAVVGDEPL